MVAHSMDAMTLGFAASQLHGGGVDCGAGEGLAWNEKCHVLLLILVFLPKCLGGLNSGQVISAGKRVQSSDELRACLQVRGSKKVPRPEDLHRWLGPESDGFYFTRLF